ncbi:arginine N-succinyltransferase [Noviherbaspirillum galbum]|uniref:Arginine N-succinyltransferase n=1 Tax=Noviherbaspirillum galbum TaxID=2709383 RepID=A0A6B3SHD2_9BURK|nr:arginine N-succinyltransferase [Noviherbaspirillum galbum]NEX60281.1 arginine N-succinyltransferase [Noviherbaspirillum galbum]
MFVVRPVEESDIAGLEELALAATPGVHTLPRSRAAIERAVERSVASFAAHPDVPGEEMYFFLMEAADPSDPSRRRIAGTAAIAATAGASGTFFAFRNDVLHQVSRDLNISHNVHALTLCSDLTSHSQLSGFYLRSREGAGVEAALLSRARLLFAAIAPHRFGDKFFASMSGMTDAAGRSPFWEALGRKFFQMDFLAAERLIEGARNRTLIVELMPHYPVYVPLLPGEAQAAMGQVHAEGKLPFRILSDEGFEPDEYIDIFDGGPILRAHKHALRSFHAGMTRTVNSVQQDEGNDEMEGSYLVAAAGEGCFRATIADCAPSELSDGVVLPPDVRRLLAVGDGDDVLCVKL